VGGLSRIPHNVLGLISIDSGHLNLVGDLKYCKEIVEQSSR
jgi:hypothetical protein